MPRNLKIHQRADRLADPVALHFLCGFRPVHLVQTFQKPLGILYDVDDPLAHVLAHNRITAALALAVDDLVVGQNGAQFLAPVDRHFDALRQTAFKQLLEYPLRPFVERRIACRYLAVPVVAEAQHFQLTLKCFDIFQCEAVGIVAGLDRILLRRQTKAVKTHRMEYVVPLHALHAADDVGRRVALRMAGMQAHPRRIREHVQRVKLRFGEVPGIGCECFVFLPYLLPFCLNTLVIVAHKIHPFSNK